MYANRVNSQQWNGHDTFAEDSPTTNNSSNNNNNAESTNGFVTILEVNNNNVNSASHVTRLKVTSEDTISTEKNTIVTLKQHNNNNNGTKDIGLTVEEVTLYRLPGERLGMGLKFDGGEQVTECIHQLFIQSITPESPASRTGCQWGRLQEGDKILQIERQDVSSMTRLDCVSLLKDAPVALRILVQHHDAYCDVPGNPHHNGTASTSMSNGGSGAVIGMFQCKDDQTMAGDPKNHHGDLNGDGYEQQQPVPPARKFRGSHRIPAQSYYETNGSTSPVLELNGNRTSSKDHVANRVAKLMWDQFGELPVEADVYTDLIAEEDKKLFEYESDDTGSSVSTVVDRYTTNFYDRSSPTFQEKISFDLAQALIPFEQLEKELDTEFKSVIANGSSGEEQQAAQELLLTDHKQSHLCGNNEQYPIEPPEIFKDFQNPKKVEPLLHDDGYPLPPTLPVKEQAKSNIDGGYVSQERKRFENFIDQATPKETAFTPAPKVPPKRQRSLFEALAERNENFQKTTADSSSQENNSTSNTDDDLSPPTLRIRSILRKKPLPPPVPPRQHKGAKKVSPSTTKDPSGRTLLQHTFEAEGPMSLTSQENHYIPNSFIEPMINSLEEPQNRENSDRLLAVQTWLEASVLAQNSTTISDVPDDKPQQEPNPASSQDLLRLGGATGCTMSTSPTEEGSADVTHEQPLHHHEEQQSCSEGATGEMESGQAEEEEAPPPPPLPPPPTLAILQPSCTTDGHFTPGPDKQPCAATGAQQHDQTDNAMTGRDGLGASDLEDQFSPSISRLPPDGHEFPPVFADPMNCTVQQQQQQQLQLHQQHRPSSNEPDGKGPIKSQSSKDLFNDPGDSHLARESPHTTETEIEVNKTCDEDIKEHPQLATHHVTEDEKHSVLDGHGNSSTPCINDHNTLVEGQNNAIVAQDKMTENVLNLKDSGDLEVDVYAKCSDEILDNEISGDQNSNGDSDSVEKTVESSENTDMENSIDESPVEMKTTIASEPASLETFKNTSSLQDKSRLPESAPEEDKVVPKLGTVIEKPPIKKINSSLIATFGLSKPSTKSTDNIVSSKKPEKATNRRHSIDFSASNGSCGEKLESQQFLRSVSRDSAPYGAEFYTLRRNNSTSLYSLLESRRQKVSKLKGLIIPDKANENQRCNPTKSALPLPTIKSSSKPVSVPVDRFSSLPRGISLHNSNAYHSNRPNKREKREGVINGINEMMQISHQNASRPIYQNSGIALPNNLPHESVSKIKSRKTMPNQNGLSASLDALLSTNNETCRPNFDLNHMNSGSLQQLKPSKPSSADFSTIKFRKTAPMAQNDTNANLKSHPKTNSFSNPILTSYESTQLTGSRQAASKTLGSPKVFDASGLQRRWNSDIDNNTIDLNHNKLQQESRTSPKRDNRVYPKDLLQQVSDERWMQLERKYTSNATAEKTLLMESGHSSSFGPVEEPTCKEILLDPQFKPKRLSQQKTVLNNQTVSGDSVKSFKALAEQWEQRSLEVGPIPASSNPCGIPPKSSNNNTTNNNKCSSSNNSRLSLNSDFKFYANNVGKQHAADMTKFIPELNLNKPTEDFAPTSNLPTALYNMYTSTTTASSIKGNFTVRGLGNNATRETQISRTHNDCFVNRSLHHETTHLIPTDSYSVPSFHPQQIQEIERPSRNGHSDNNIDKSQHEIIVVDLQRDIPGGSIGIALSGGADYDSKEITVHKIITGSLADRDGRIKKGDRVLFINGHNLQNATHRESLQLLKEPTCECVLVIARSFHSLPETSQNIGLSTNHIMSTFCSQDVVYNNDRNRIDDFPATNNHHSSNSKICAIRLLKDASGLGFSLEGGRDSPCGDKPLTVKKIFKGGAAERNGTLKAGDEILFINGIDVSQMSRIEAWHCMKKQPDGLLELVFQ